MKIIWTKQAKFQLQEIFYFYKENESLELARRIKNKILDGSEKLKLSNIQRQEEELLKPLLQQHRFLITGNYKIIYLNKTNSVYVTDVFDTRQSPNKMITRNR
jgi:plasmid stabilization system protein ParE